jgi:hypothetical protein
MSPARYASDDDMDAATWCRHLVPDRSVYATGVLGAAPAGVGLHGGGGRGRHPGHGHPVAAIRRVRRLIPAARAVKLDAHDYDRPGKPDCDQDDSDAKQALVSGLVNDAPAVLAAVAYAELGAKQAEAVALLALVTGQDVEAGERPGTFRIPGGSPATG